MLLPASLVRYASGLVALGVFAALGCRGGSPGFDERDMTPTVRVTHPEVKQVTEYVTFTGRTKAVNSVDLQSRVTGYLDSIDFTAGDYVEAGKQLFKIDPRTFQSQLDIANAQVTLAQARLKLADADLARANELLRTPGVISQAEFDKNLAAQAEADAQVAAARANAKDAQNNLDYTSIVAPFAGVVGRNYPSIGALIRQDDTKLTTLVSQDPIYAFFEADEQTLLRVGRLINEGKIRSRENGAIVNVELALADEVDAFPHEGTMDFTGNRVSPTTGTLEIRAVFKNPLLSDKKRRMFIEGMFVRVRVPLGDPHEALLVREAAIGADQDRRFVLVVNDEDVVEQRLVEVGTQQPGGMQVVVPTKIKQPGATSEDETIESLTPQDRVIVGGLQLVRPGTKVKVREIESE
jgi:multidrug efflux system membrane fusion protein